MYDGEFGGSDEVGEVGLELWRSHQLIYRAFDCYAALDLRQGGIVAIRRGA